MIVRREAPRHVEAVRTVVADAFVRPGSTGPPIEVGLLDRLRADPGWLPALSLVVEAPEDGAVLGHVVCTRGRAGGHPGLGLGPIAVRPDRQGHGVGSALMHAVLGAAEACGETLVALLGEPAFYARFGFRAAVEHGVEAPDPAWGRYFQVRVLGDGPAPAGRFVYATPFAGL